MSFQYTLQKVLEIKERKKNEVEADYTEASSLFEKTATELYNLLKKKEDFEEGYKQQISQGISVNQLQQYETVLSRYQGEIERQQKSTQIARDKMHRKQDALVTMSIELKKYEKMKELKHQEYLEEVKREESKLMDEISVQQFANR
ncbi:flagellar export protein FliJ [Bacillus sp. FJAT-45350]|uniref:flagellar export protein FliJ n=1 Tax=Bacillus sp. FJAT-45350 TaxID=2011014 RepID=UPI000BB84734|nr:flagellar export protein FliJ [Bacillus sp. FJAT-45350]